MSSQSPVLSHRPTALTRWAAATIVGGALLAPLAALAQQEPAQGTTWGLGIGAASTQKPYTDMSRHHSAIPLLHFENRYARFFGTALEVKLPGLRLTATQRLRFGLVARYDGSGYEADDSWMLEGMDKRKGGIWGGARAEWQTSLANVHAEWTHDLSGNSKGQRFDLGVDRTWRVTERFSLTPRVVATWHDSKYVDYYYGVRAEEARTWRPAYEGGSGVATEIGLRGVYRFNQHHSMMLDVRATRLASDVKDSPLVDRSTENRVFLGYLYHF